MQPRMHNCLAMHLLRHVERLLPLNLLCRRLRRADVERAVLKEGPFLKNVRFYNYAAADA